MNISTCPQKSIVLNEVRQHSLSTKKCLIITKNTIFNLSLKRHSHTARTAILAMKDAINVDQSTADRKAALAKISAEVGDHHAFS